MHIIVILDVAAVALVDLPYEARQLQLIHLRQLVDVEHLQDVDGQNGEGCLPAHDSAELESVELDAVGPGELLFVLLDVVVNRVEARRPRALL